MENNFTADEKTLEKINRYARNPLTAEEVYCFSVILCDNEIDRDNEKFSVESLNSLAKLFIGKTGIFDHDPKGENQTARIYDTNVKTFKDRKTRDGEDYTALTGYAYMLRTNKNHDLIMEIDGGIKKEVSVSCRIENTVCSVCGKDISKKSCSHIKGKTYGEKLCFHILANPSDAYEWSFVAVPAQVNAGVTKRFSANDNYSEVQKQLNEKSAELAAACDYLRGEILKLSYFAKPFRSAEFVAKMTESMDAGELIKLKKDFENQLKNDEKNLAAEQESFITAIYDDEENDNENFKI